MSQLLNEHVASLLELLEQSSLQLQSSISDFIQQIKTRAIECADNNSDTQMIIEDVLAMITSAQSTIIEHTDKFTESTKLYPPTVMTEELRTPESLKPADTKFISKASTSETPRRLKEIETALLTLQDTKQKTEDDISEIKQWRENLRKQLKEQDNKIEDLNQQIESLKTKESAKQENSTKTFDNLLSKIETLEKEVLKLSQDLQSIANQQVGFIVSQGGRCGKSYSGYNVITFKSVDRNTGNHFDPKTGLFTAPVDGLYKASLTIKQTGDHAVEAEVVHIAGFNESRLGAVRSKEKSVEAEGTFYVLMKKSDVLFSATDGKDLQCSHFSCSLLGIKFS